MSIQVTNLTKFYGSQTANNRGQEISHVRSNKTGKGQMKEGLHRIGNRRVAYNKINSLAGVTSQGQINLTGHHNGARKTGATIKNPQINRKGKGNKQVASYIFMVTFLAEG